MSNTLATLVSEKWPQWNDLQLLETSWQELYERAAQVHNKITTVTAVLRTVRTYRPAELAGNELTAGAVAAIHKYAMDSGMEFADNDLNVTREMRSS